MGLDPKDLQILRQCCRDDAAFQRVCQFLRQHLPEDCAVPTIGETCYEAILHAIPDLMFRIRKDGTYLDCRADRESDFAIAPSQMLGRTVYELLPPELAQQRMYYVAQALQTGIPQTFEYRMLNHGEMRDYEARVVVCGEDEVLAIVRDLTDRKRAEQQIRLDADCDRIVAEMALRIHQSLDLNQILSTTVAEVRQFLQADRVFIGQIDATCHGCVLAEAMTDSCTSIQTWLENDIYLREIRALFEHGAVQAIDDTHQSGLTPLLAEYYQRCQILSSLGVPITIGDEFFGILIANQCTTKRHWLQVEIDLLTRLATQVGIAIQQGRLYQQVQSLNAELEQKVLDRTAELRQKMQQLEELSKAQDDFLHAVSHDLRTPLMGMGLVLKNLQSQTGETISFPRSAIDLMVQSCDRQISMLNSLLEVHSADVKGIALNPQPTDVAALITAIVAEMDPLLLANQAVLINQVPPHLPLLSVDAEQLRRVFENLITNALQHNPPGLTLTISANLDETMLRCIVQDNGVGMSDVESRSLFDRYVRGDRSRRSAGIGLGLYLCRQIILAHGGHIGVTSSPGEGATFWLTLPLAGVTE